jgi:hypothetical protein
MHCSRLVFTYMYSVLAAVLPATQHSQTSHPNSWHHRHQTAPPPAQHLHRGCRGWRRQQVAPYRRPRCHRRRGCGADDVGRVPHVSAPLDIPKATRSCQRRGAHLIAVEAAEARNNGGYQRRSLHRRCRDCTGMALVADCTISQFPSPSVPVLLRAGLMTKTECHVAMPVVVVVDVAGFGEDCGVHHVTAPVVVKATQDDKVAPSLSPPSSSSNGSEEASMVCPQMQSPSSS